MKAPSMVVKNYTQNHYRREGYPCTRNGALRSMPTRWHSFAWDPELTRVLMEMVNQLVHLPPRFRDLAHTLASASKVQSYVMGLTHPGLTPAQMFPSLRRVELINFVKHELVLIKRALTVVNASARPAAPSTAPATAEARILQDTWVTARRS